MTQSGATPSLPMSRDLLRLMAGDSPDWARIAACVRGPLLTLAAVVMLDSCDGTTSDLRSPFPVLILTVVYSAYIGGLRPALVSVTVSLLYALHFFAEPGFPLRYHARGRRRPRRRDGVDAGRGPARLATLRPGPAGRGARAVPGRRRGADAAVLVPRAGVAHSGSGPPVRRGLPRPRPAARARRWPTGAPSTWPARTASLRFVAGAHRDASRDFVVRALAEYGPRALPFASAPTAPEVVEVTEALLPRLRLGRGGAQAVPRAGAEGGAPAAAPRARPDGRLPHPGDGERLGPPLRAGGRRRWRRSWPATRAWPSTTCASARTRRRPTAAPGWSSTPIPSRCGSSTWTRWRSWRSTRPRCSTTAGPTRSSGR